MAKRDESELVTPAEALKLYDESGAEVLVAALRVALAFQDDPDRWRGDQDSQLDLMACLWNAGRVQGVREERRKNRRRRRKKGLTQCKSRDIMAAGGERHNGKA